MESMDLGEFHGEGQELKTLSWRDDLGVSLSDYVVEIITDELAEDGPAPKKTYNVHRCQLAVGQRSCEYFSKLFLRESVASTDSKKGISAIALPKSAADVFPSFLDFVYGGPLVATSWSAVPLLHLANHFGNRAAYEATVLFIRKNLDATTAIVHLAHADAFRLEKVAGAAFKIVSENFSSIDVDTLATLEPKLFMRLVQSSLLKCGSGPLSLRVAGFCRVQPTNISSTFLDSAASEAKMPEVDGLAALTLLQQALKYESASLRKRCVKSLAQSWKHVLQIDTSEDPPAKRRRTSEDFEVPLDVKLEIAITALHDAEAALKAEKTRTDIEKLRADNLQRVSAPAKKAVVNASAPAKKEAPKFR